MRDGEMNRQFRDAIPGPRNPLRALIDGVLFARARRLGDEIGTIFMPRGEIEEAAVKVAVTRHPADFQRRTTVLSLRPPGGWNS